jgi:hypothetical protein
VSHLQEDRLSAEQTVITRVVVAVVLLSMAVFGRFAYLRATELFNILH